MASRKYDILVWGATSFTGTYLAEYLALNSPPGTKIAFGGRNRAKVEDVRSRLAAKHPAATTPIESMDILTGNSLDFEQMCEVARQTRVIASTVGPYGLYGEPLVRACVAEKTDYCDITGEAPWAYQMHEKFNEQAVQNGVHIVPMCGFDCIPADLGCLMLAKYAQDEFSEPLLRANSSILGVRARVSGGTLVSMVDHVRRESKRKLARWRSGELRPDDIPRASRGSGPPVIHYDRKLKRWQTYWLMSTVNQMTVDWANIVLNYGPGFNYHESMCVKNLPQGIVFAAGLFIGVLCMFFSVTRSLLYACRIIPRPGEGPSDATIQNGYFSLHLEAKTKNHVVYGKVSASTDPGYGETKRYLGESALCLALDRDSSFRAGVYPPSVAMGTALLERLRSKGCQFDVGLEPIAATAPKKTQ